MTFSRGYSIPLCIVVRHLSPSEEQILTENGASEGSAHENDVEAKRPCRKLKVSLIHFQTLVLSLVYSQLSTL